MGPSPLEDFFFLAVGAVIAVLVVGFVAFVVMLGGYGMGLWAAPCPLDSSQPKCIQAGWGNKKVYNLNIQKPVK